MKTVHQKIILSGDHEVWNDHICELIYWYVSNRRRFLQRHDESRNVRRSRLPDRSSADCMLRYRYHHLHIIIVSCCKVGQARGGCNYLRVSYCRNHLQTFAAKKGVCTYDWLRGDLLAELEEFYKLNSHASTGLKVKSTVESRLEDTAERPNIVDLVLEKGTYWSMAYPSACYRGETRLLYGMMPGMIRRQSLPTISPSLDDATLLCL